MKEIDSKTAAAVHEGMRLDRFLQELLPESGLRERRRLIENGFVTVNGRACKSGFKLIPGVRVAVFSSPECDCAAEIISRISLIGQSEEFAAIAKPDNMHSAWVAGSSEASVEECLGELFPEEEPMLVNRLDKLTSGLLLVAFGVTMEALFREYEDAGQVEKYYLARVYGTPESDLIMKNRLDTADRKRTRVLNESDDPVRWSMAVPLKKFEDGTTLLQVRIAKGARHQIRAHLAYAGYPIVGDPLYGRKGESGRMYLHHRRMVFPGFEALCEPLW